MSQDDTFADKVLQKEQPTLEEAIACENCRAIRRCADRHRCIVCGSESVFDLAAMLKGKNDGRGKIQG